MVFGIGSDVVFVPRMLRAHQKFGVRFVRRILTDSERASMVIHKSRAASKAVQTKQTALYLARCWAAKEALGKAVGWGIRAPVLLQNMTVENDSLGKPVFTFASPLQNFLNERGITQCHLTLSHDGDYVFASVIAESKAG